ncbi:ribonuclease H1 domain-containing protein [Polluticaenibacter yanchengensis]|uniref:Ribonuclease H n=1 Tax=Polluticaenibacter yanchengensis TaxID=3014562 RepID=A0ABT4UGN6_9BACT|nr:ribonuclease H family protein [Chitinophagaceae bacterium LY-5]
MVKKKYYVVWVGRQSGIFESWEDCSEQVSGYPKAVYKSFKTKELAEQAFKSESKEFIGKDIVETELTSEQIALIGEPIKDSISVDGAWNTETGVVEYQGVHTAKGNTLFKVGPMEDGTNNIVEFLAIVHALAYCKQQNLKLPIYSDSRNAIGWVKNKQARTKLDRSDKNEKLFELIDRAIKWLKENEYDNLILKWETKAWGENPADFGRK